MADQGGTLRGPGKKIWMALGLIVLALLLCMLVALAAGPRLFPQQAAVTATSVPAATPLPTEVPPTVAASTGAVTAPPSPMPSATPTATFLPGTPTPIPAAMCVIISDGVNLRSGPGTVYTPPIRVLAKGTQLKPFAYSAVGYPDRQWIAVQVQPDGQFGWVTTEADLVSCNVDVTTLPPGAAPPTPGALPTNIPPATATNLPTNMPSLTATPRPRPTQIALSGAHPRGMALDPDLNRLFVAGRDTNSLYAIDEKTLRVVATVAVGQQPLGVAYLNGYVYVANNGSDTVSVIPDRVDATPTQEIALSRLGREPTHLVANPDAGVVYGALHATVLVARLPSTGIYEIATNDGIRISRSVPTGRGTFGVAVNTAAQRIFVANRDSLDMAVVGIDNFTLLPGEGATGLPGSPFFVATDARSPYVYLTHSADPANTDKPDQLSVYGLPTPGVSTFRARNIVTFIRTVKVGAMDPDGGWVAIYPPVGSSWDGSVWISANKRVQVYSADLSQQLHVYGPEDGIGSDPYAIVINPSLGRVYVGDGDGNRVTVLNVR